MYKIQSVFLPNLAATIRSSSLDLKVKSGRTYYHACSQGALARDAIRIMTSKIIDNEGNG